MIQPLATICELINDEHLEQELRQIPLDQQAEVFETIKLLLTDEILFILTLHQTINKLQRAKEIH